MITVLIITLLAIAFIGYLKRIALTSQLKKIREAAQTEIARLRELSAAQQATNETLREGYDRMSQIAKTAIEVAAQKHFPADTVIEFPAPPRPSESIADYSVEVRHYVPPINAFCPQCNVSVRHEAHEYPVKCPACQTLIDPTFDFPPEF